MFLLAVSFNDEVDVERQPSPSPQPTSSCQALRHAVSALTRIDDFILEELGDGFFANVYKATHKVTGEEMVMKVNKDSANRPSALREVQLMNRLSHPNILRFLGVCVHEGQLHALTEYVSGGTLGGMLANKDEELPWTLRIKLSLDIAKGIYYLHNEGVFHRDLTSKNVLIKKKESKNYTAIVADFGLATKIPDPSSTEPLPPVGCPWWMAPEVIHAKFYDQRADIFSLGIILLEITTRIDADPEYMPRTQKFGVDYIKVCEMVDYCPLDFLQFAFKCCQILPENRPSTEDVKETLEKIYTNLRNDGFTSQGRLYKRSRSEDNIIQNCEASSDEVFITAQVVAQVMRKDDPLYCPANANPFASMGTLKDGHKLFEMPRQRKFSSSSSFNSEIGSGFRRWESVGSCNISFGQESQSLPSSPIMLRKAAEKLHQASLHGKEAVQAGSSRHDISFSLSSEGYESGGPISWDEDTALESEDAISYDQQGAEARREKFNCNRTRSLGSLDFWTPPRRLKGAGVSKALRTPGGDAHMAQDTGRPGFCNRVTSEIRESSLENILEPPSSVAISSAAYCGEGDTTCADNVTEHTTSLACEEESMCEASTFDNDLNGSSAYNVVSGKIQAISCHYHTNLIDSAMSKQNDCNSNIVSVGADHSNIVEDKMMLVEDEPINKNSDRQSMSSSSLSSYVSCSDMGEDTEAEGDTSSLSGLLFPQRLPASPVHRPCHSTRQPLIERTLLVNSSNAPVKPRQTDTPNECIVDTSMQTPLIAAESGSYDQNHFGQASHLDMAMKQ
ncbi:dual specificity testis-specific protein kinase 2 [Elysia marginata]|uniref:dual-specificity kinase n=1 Tax=Elysia marginata TaxID=1093978 RepID=A0AAV4ELU8_9GAST|nr:dual specificity testis-specific protein kinase 2 [Elysia marginata]